MFFLRRVLLVGGKKDKALSVASFFYSSRLGYFENILARPFDEGRGPLQEGRRALFSNRLFSEE